MEEKLLKEMLAQLKNISERLTVQPGVNVRGPVGDPGPDIQHHGHAFRRFPMPVGYNVDPSPEFYLSKDLLAQVKVKEIDITITQVTEQLELLKLQRDLMKKEYNIR